MNPTDVAKPALSALAHIKDTMREAVNRLEAARQTQHPWPAWCYVPVGVAGATLIDADGITNDIFDALPAPRRAAYYTATTALAALSAWRMTKGVYAFDPDLLAALWETPMTGRIPTQLLYRMPEWCVYIPLPSPETPVGRPVGTFVHLDWRDGRTSLRFLLLLPKDGTGQFSAWPLDISLASGDVWEGVRSFAGQWMDGQGRRIVGEELERAQRDALALAGPLVSVALYLCTEEPDLTGLGKPGNPRPTKTKRGLREFPAAGIRPWEVGVRIGAVLRSARREFEGDGELLPSGRHRPRPHLRRAHYAVRWTGPKNREQKAKLIWMWERLIARRNGDSDVELPAVVRPVRFDEAE